MERMGKVILSRGAQDGKGMRTTSGKSDMRNLKAEGIRGRVESMGGCIKLNTVAE